MLAVAFSGGVLLGVLARGRARGSRLVDDYSPGLPEAPRHAGFNALKALGDNPRARQQVGETWNEILETLIGLASSKAIGLLGDVLPGFRDEYDTRHARPMP